MVKKQREVPKSETVEQIVLKDKQKREGQALGEINMILQKYNCSLIGKTVIQGSQVGSQAMIVAN